MLTGDPDSIKESSFLELKKKILTALTVPNIVSVKTFEAMEHWQGRSVEVARFFRRHV